MTKENDRFGILARDRAAALQRHAQNRKQAGEWVEGLLQETGGKNLSGYNSDQLQSALFKALTKYDERLAEYEIPDLKSLETIKKEVFSRIANVVAALTQGGLQAFKEAHDNFLRDDFANADLAPDMKKAAMGSATAAMYAFNKELAIDTGRRTRASRHSGMQTHAYGERNP